MIETIRRDEMRHGKWLIEVIDVMVAGYRDGARWDDGTHRAETVGMAEGLSHALHEMPRPAGDAKDASSALAGLKSGAWVCDGMKTPWISALSFIRSVRQAVELSICENRHHLPLVETTNRFDEDVITGHIAIDAEIEWAEREIRIGTALKHDVSPFTDYLCVLGQLRSLADNGVLEKYLTAAVGQIVDGELPRSA
jgi:hypothetical protein